jgi:alanyl-tRNA synthetase
MQQHTGQHVLTAVALRDFGWRTTAFHLGEHWSDIELDLPSLDRADLDRLEQAVAKEIFASRRVSFRSAEVKDFERLGVRSRLLPEGFEGPVRLVDIEGLDLNTCGGTHCRSTAEIGLLCLLGTEPMRGGTRVFFVAGDRVRRRMAAHEDRNLRLRSLLDTGDEELPEVVTLRLQREKELARTARLLAEELADHAAESLASDPSDAVQSHWRDRDMAFSSPPNQATPRSSSSLPVFPRACNSTRPARESPTSSVAAAAAATRSIRERWSRSRIVTRR